MILREILRQTLSLSRITEPSLLEHALGSILSSVNKLQPSDFQLEEFASQQNETHRFFRDDAPVTYVPLLEHKDFTAAIFILNYPTSRLPLHDHPFMHGILKVLWGSCRVRCFDKINLDELKKSFSTERCSKLMPSCSAHADRDIKRQKMTDCDDASKPFDKDCRHEHADESSANYRQKNGYMRVGAERLILVTEKVNALLTASSEAQVVRPQSCNFHSIENAADVGKSTAFFDILFPPYGPDSGEATWRESDASKANAARRCSYYETAPLPVEFASLSAQNVVRLRSVACPSGYYCNVMQLDEALLAQLHQELRAFENSPDAWRNVCPLSDTQQRHTPPPELTPNR